MISLSYIVLTRLDRFDSIGEFESVLALLKDWGYDGVELNITEPLGMTVDDLERLVGQYGLTIPSFLTGEAYGDGLCLCSPNSDVRRRTVDRLVGYLGTARRFGAVLVVGLLQGLRKDEPDPNRANERIIECLKTVADEAARQNVELVIEPVNHLQVGFNNSVSEVLQLISAIGSPAVRPMVDTVHLNIEERSLTQPIEQCGKALRHVHLCESNGGRFGTGHIDFAAVRRALEATGYEHWASVKVYRHLETEDAIRSSIEHLRRAGYKR